MWLRTSLGLAVGVTVILAISNCSSSTDNNTPATPDSGGATDSATTDGAKKDTGGATDANESTCKPADVSGFTPTWKPPTPFHQGKCTPSQIDSLIDDCFGDAADEASCDAAVKAAPDCNNCMDTSEGDKAWGPLVADSAGNYRVNIGGCIGNATGDTSATSCAAKYGAASQCGGAACDDVCPGDDQAAIDAYDKCIEDAAAGVCKTQEDAATCADALLDTGGAAEACNEGNDFIESAKAVSRLFCGGGGDGGTDAPADAPADG